MKNLNTGNIKFVCNINTGKLNVNDEKQDSDSVKLSHLLKYGKVVTVTPIVVDSRPKTKTVQTGVFLLTY